MATPNSFQEFLTNYIQIVVIVSTLILSLMLGVFIQRKIFPRLRKRFARSRRTNVRIILRNMEGVAVLWVIVGAFFLLFYIIGTSTFIDLDQQVENALRIGLLLILVISFTWFLSKLAHSLLSYYIRREKLPNTTIFNSIATILVYIIGLMLVFEIFSIPVSGFLAAFGIGGIAVALALQPTFESIFAGISIIATKQINIGDYVLLSSGEEGYIEDIQWRTTAIRTIQNNLIIIPNSQISGLILTNFSLPIREMVITVPVGVHYNSDLEKVEQITIEVAKDILQTIEGGVKTFEPFIRYNEFGPSSINFNVVLRVNEFSQHRVIKHEFIKRLHRRFKQESIIIPFPIRTLDFSNLPKNLHLESD